MTAEEKARAYDEAMDRCKEWVSGTWEHSVDDTPKDIAEFIFPQLAESENEKIRKELVAFFKEMRDTWHEIYWHDLQVEGILAWLEEQKEPENVSASTMIPSCWAEKQKENPKSANSISSDCTSDAKCEDRWHKVEDSLPDNGREVLAKDKLGNTLLARYDGEEWDVSVYDDEDYRCHNGISKWCEIPSEKQKEQKQLLSEKFRPDFPAVADFIESVNDMEKNRAIGILEDYLEWAVSSEEECRYTWKELADAIQLGINAMKERKQVENPKKGCPTYPLSVVGDLLAKTPQEPIEFVPKQKPAECADDVVEEAEEYTSKVACGEYGVEVTEAYIAGVLSERNRGTEWSEGDENMLWNIISIVGESKSIQADEMLDWLKSLSPSWKPNVDDADEQPEADLEKEIQKYLEKLGGGHGGYVDDLTDDDLMGFARHFYELGLKSK